MQILLYQLSILPLHTWNFVLWWKLSCSFLLNAPSIKPNMTSIEYIRQITLKKGSRISGLGTEVLWLELITTWFYGSIFRSICMIFELTSTAFQGSAVTLTTPQILWDWSKYFNAGFASLPSTGSIPPCIEVFFLLCKVRHTTQRHLRMAHFGVICCEVIRGSLAGWERVVHISPSTADNSESLQLHSFHYSQFLKRRWLLLSSFDRHRKQLLCQVDSD